MKAKIITYISKLAKILIIFISLININPTILMAEQLLNEMEIGGSTKLDPNSSDLPTNPFEIVEMLRRANSMNDATKPSDAIDDALKSFNEIEEK